MNRIAAFAVLALLLLPNIGFAQWMSDVDKKYQASNPSLYSQVARANDLISRANGNTSALNQANAILESVLRSSPDFAPAYVQFGRLMTKLGYQGNNTIGGAELLLQERYLKKALELEPNYDYAMAMMGYTKMFQGKLDEAEQYYKKVEAMGSGYPFLKSQLAQLATKRGDYKKAAAISIQAYEDNKSGPRVAASIITEIISANKRMSEDRTVELEKWYTKRRDLAPDVAWFWGDHAQFRLYSLGDYEGAIKYSTKALALMNYRAGQHILAAAYYKKWATLKDDGSRKFDAYDALKNATDIDPDPTDYIREFESYPNLQSAGVALKAWTQTSKLKP